MGIIERVRRLDVDRRAKDFAVYARLLMMAGGNEVAALDAAEREDAPREVVTRLKAAVAGDTTDTSALADYRFLADGFIAALANVGVFDAMLADMVPAPLRAKFGITVSRPSAAAHLPGNAIGVSTMRLAQASLAEQEASAILVLSNDLLRYSAVASALVDQNLRLAVASATDLTFITALIAAATSPVTASGLDASGVLHDLRLALDALSTGAASRLHVAMGSAVAKRLSTLATSTGARAFAEMRADGGALAGMPAHVSDHLSDSVLIVDAAGFAADGGSIDVSASSAAALKMTDSSTVTIAGGSPPAPVEGNAVSMFQANSTALKANRQFGFEAMRASVAMLTGVQWGLVGSPPA